MPATPINLTGAWTELYAASGIPAGTPLLIYVDGGAASVAISDNGAPASTEYDCEGVQGEQLIVGGVPNAAVYARAPGGQATIRVQRDVDGAVRKAPWADSRTLDGDKAVTAQSLTEVHVKKGEQFEAAFYQASLAASGTIDLVVQTGAKTVQFKTLRTQFDSELLSSQLFKGPSFTGGTPLPIYNLNDKDAVATTITLLAGVTTSATGTAVGARNYSIGTAGQGNRAVTTLSQEVDIDRILEANSEYLLRIINEDTTNATQLASSASWFEGLLTTELP